MKPTPLIIPGFFLSLLMLLTFANQALGADCLAIRKQIEGKFDLLQRTDLAKQGISDCPNDPIINFEYAYSMERLRKYKLALRHYQVAAKLDSKYAKSYFGMGDMYMQLERPGDAVKAYQAGLSLEPANKRAKNSLDDAKSAAKNRDVDNDEIASFVSPLEASKAKKPAPKTKKTSGENPRPYEPSQTHTMQKPEIMRPLIANPLQAETIQGIEFNKAGHSDITGTLDDSQMGAD